MTNILRPDFTAGRRPAGSPSCFACEEEQVAHAERRLRLLRQRGDHAGAERYLRSLAAERILLLCELAIAGEIPAATARRLIAEHLGALVATR